MVEPEPFKIDPQTRQELEQAGVIFAYSAEELKSHDLEGLGEEITLLLTKWTEQPNPAWSLLKEAKILDLAGGAAGGTEEEELRDPIFARICAVNGARVTVVDLHPQSATDQKLFNSRVMDLIEAVRTSQLTSAFPGEQFDLIHSTNFIGPYASPQLERSLADKGIKMDDFTQQLTEQCFPLLAEKGILSLDEYGTNNRPIIYQKINGVIIRV